MGRSNGLVPHALPKHSWPARQKEKLDKPGATDSFLAISSMLCQQMQASVPQQERTKVFHHLTEAVQSVCDMKEFAHYLSVFRDMKVTSPGGSACGSRGGSRPRHRAVAVGYNPIGLSRSDGSLFPINSPMSNVEDLRLRRHDAIMEASFLLVGDGASRAFRGSGIPAILQKSLLAMGSENFDMIDPMKAFQGSSFNHVGCPLGLLSHLTFIYQCEIRDDGTITLNVIWTKLLQDDDDGSGSSPGAEDGTYRLRYCKASIDTFNVMDPRQAAKLFAWIHSIAQWALKERHEALKMAQQLDDVRQRRFQHANISLLQEFGADLSTTWLSDHILKSVPGPPTIEHLAGQNDRIGRSPASARSKSLQSPAKKERTPTPPVQQQQQQPPLPPPLPTPPPMMAWKGLLPAHKLAGFPKEYASRLPNSSATSPAATVVSLSGRLSGKETEMQKELAQRLLLMTKIYDAILQSPERGKLAADILLNKAPLPVS
jgi:hypothetical protein